MIDPQRLIAPDDEFHRAFPNLDFRETYAFDSSGEDLLVTDPIYLANVYSSKDDIASYLRAHGIFVMNFGGDTSGPILSNFPDFVIPISQDAPDEVDQSRGISVAAEQVGCDSGSFIFLPLTSDIPAHLQTKIDQVLAEGNGATLNLLPGHWAVYYEQGEPRDGWPHEWFRNIVLRLESRPNASP